MRLTALIAAALIAVPAAPALAQTAPSGEGATSRGVTVEAARTWLTSVGGTVGAPEAAPGRTVLRVADTLPWTLNFFACTTLCDDVQFAASFTGPITEAQATEWNRENRYVKAVWIAPATAGGSATVLAQYDVLLTGSGPEQLSGATAVWLQQLNQFTRAMSQGVAAAQ